MIYDERPATEKWPITSRLRLFELLKRYKTHAVLLSGDVHFAEIGRREGLHEITSSGLSFSIGDHLAFAEKLLLFLPNLYNNASDRYVGPNYGLVRINSSDDGAITTVELIVRSSEGQTKLYREIPFNDTVVRDFNQTELERNHLPEAFSYAFNRVLSNPFRALYILPLSWPWLIGLWTLRELLRWRID